MSSADLPFSSSIDNNALARVFKNKSSTYKYYWFLSILEEIENERVEIRKAELFANMVVLSHYPISKYKLNFGLHDNLDKCILSCQDEFGLDFKMSKRNIKQKIMHSFNQKGNACKEIIKLNNTVPHWFLAPWFPKFDKAKIYSKSQENNYHSPYKLEYDRIVINENWLNYFQKHLKILKHFILWNLAQFVQNKNPNTPNIINKLVKPVRRKPLTSQRKFFWDLYFKKKGKVKCLFTNNDLMINNYHLDHFVPHCFVTHDLIWNLVPIDPDFNGTKSDSLPVMNKHFEEFYKLQKDALIAIGDDLKDNFIEEYLYIFNKFENYADFKYERFKNTIEPLISVASNNGFEFLE